MQAGQARVVMQIGIAKAWNSKLEIAVGIVFGGDSDRVQSAEECT